MQINEPLGQTRAPLVGPLTAFLSAPQTVEGGAIQAAKRMHPSSDQFLECSLLRCLAGLAAEPPCTTPAVFGHGRPIDRSREEATP